MLNTSLIYETAEVFTEFFANANENKYTLNFLVKRIWELCKVPKFQAHSIS